MTSKATRIAYLKRMLKRLEGEDERLPQLASSQGLTGDAEKVLIQQLEKSREELISELRSLEAESEARTPEQARRMMEVHDSVVSPDGALKVTLVAFDPRTGEGRITVEELHRDRGRFYVTVKYGEAGQHRIDYKTYDVYKASEFPFRTNRNDGIKAIDIVQVPAD